MHSIYLYSMVENCEFCENESPRAALLAQARPRYKLGTYRINIISLSLLSLLPEPHSYDISLSSLSSLST